MESTFRQYQVRADIRGGAGVLWRWGLTRRRWSERSIFSNFGRHIFIILRVKANIVMQRHVPYRLSINDP